MDHIDALHRIADLWDEADRDASYKNFHESVGEILQIVGYLVGPWAEGYEDDEK
jgi:hypothetical protein